MAGLVCRELEGGIDLEGGAEFIAAALLAARNAVDEGEILVRLDLVVAAEPLVEARLQQARGLAVVCVLGTA